MRRSFGFWFGDDAPDPPPQSVPPRPPTFFELIDKWLDNGKLFLFVVAVVVIMLFATVCIAAIVLAVGYALKGVRVPAHVAWPVGAGGGSLVTLVTALVAGRIRKSVKASRDAAGNDNNRDGKP